MQKNIHHNNPQEAGIDLRQLLKRCRRNWYLFLLIPALIGALASFLLRYQVPVYEVKSSVLLRDEKNKQGVSSMDLIAKELGLVSDKKMVIDESKIMSSYTIIERVVNKLKLDRIVYRKGTIKDVELYGGTAPIQIDSFTLRDTAKGFKALIDIISDTQYEIKNTEGWYQKCTFGTLCSSKYGDFSISKSNNTDIIKDKHFVIECSSPEKAIKGIIKSIDMVLPKKESNIIEPTIKTTMPNKAKDIIYAMVDEYNNYRLADKKIVSQSTLNFIDRRLDSLTSELTNVESDIEIYKKKEGITESQADIGYFFSRLNQYDGELVKLEVQNDILEGIDKLLRKPLITFELLPTNLEIKSSSLMAQINEYNKLVLDRNKLVKVAGENNPNLKNLTEDLYNLKRAIIDNVTRIKQENKSLLVETQSKNNQYAYKLGKNPRNERELTDIKRQQNIKQGLYLFLLQKQEETAIAMIDALPDARIIDKPTAGDIPMTKRKPVLLVAAIFAALVLTFFIVLLQGLFINTLQSESDITSKTSMPILAKIPFTKGNSGLITGEGNNSVSSEMFGFLRSNIQFLMPVSRQNTEGSVVLITSTKRGEGKSFISLNLGMSFALSNKKTIIVNLDLRRQNKLFDTISSDTTGISQYLTTELYPHEIIQNSGRHKNLYYIDSGSRATNAAGLLTNSKLKELISYLKNNFDYILITTPPVGLVSDALHLKSVADMTLFITRLGFTRHSDMKIIDSFEQNLNLPNPVIVLNGVPMGSQKENVYYNETALTEYASDKKVKNTFSGSWLKGKLS
jgi:capsular exopolysaccharide synthesis family protein